MTPPLKSKARANRRTAVPAHARQLAVVLELLVVLALISAAFPLAVTNPIWWLRLADAMVNLAPVLLLAVILLRFSSLFLTSSQQQGSSLRTQTVQLVTRWCVVFALLVPLQVMCFAWLWVESGNQLAGQISRESTQLAALRSRLITAGSEAELQRVLATTTPGLLPPLAPGPLPRQKAQLDEALTLSFSRLQTNLSAQRAGTLVKSIPGALRVLIGAASVAAILFTMRRHFQ
jgi:hypothetical protein